MEPTANFDAPPVARKRWPHAKPTLDLTYSDGSRESLMIPGARPGESAEAAFIRLCEENDRQAHEAVKQLAALGLLGTIRTWEISNHEHVKA